VDDPGDADEVAPVMKSNPVAALDDPLKSLACDLWTGPRNRKGRIEPPVLEPRRGINRSGCHVRFRVVLVFCLRDPRGSPLHCSVRNSSAPSGPNACTARRRTNSRQVCSAPVGGTSASGANTATFSPTPGSRTDR
jgi:hypothetical protein